MDNTNAVAEGSGTPPCYASVRYQSPADALPDAISQLIAAVEKFDDAPVSASTHFATAIVRMVSCLPGWEPNDYQREEVNNACELLKMLVPERFEA